MIPQTYPSILNGIDTSLKVYPLSSVVGLQAWVDYIPVKQSSTGNKNSYDGYILSNAISSISGLQAWLDYIPVFVDNTLTKPFSTDVGGYIPISEAVLEDINTLLLMHFDGADGSTTFTDSSQYANVLTANGGAVLSTTDPSLGSASGVFNGTTSYISTPNTASRFDFGTGDFNISCRVNFDTLTGSLDYNILSGNVANSFMFLISGTAPNLQLRIGRNLVAFDSASSLAPFVTGQWYKLDAVRTSGVLKMYINDVQVYSATNTQSYGFGGQVWVGTRLGGAYFKGSIDELIVKNTAPVNP